MLKKVLSLVLSAAMLASVFMTSALTVSAEDAGMERPAGYLITEDKFTDDLDDLTKMYDTSAKDPNGWNIYKVTNTQADLNSDGTANTINGYSIKWQTNGNDWGIDNHYIAYKAEPGRKITKASFTVWMNSSQATAGTRPAIKINNGAKEVDGIWYKLKSGSEENGWEDKMQGFFEIEGGAEEIRLYFKGLRQYSNSILDKTELTTSLNPAKKTEIIYDNCHSLDNMAAYNNLEVIEDNSETGGNFNNGGYMIRMINSGYSWDAIYQIPEGRTFSEMWVEYSRQDSTKDPKLEYSTDGKKWTAAEVTWTGTGTAGSGQISAGWSHKRVAAMRAPEDGDVDASQIRYVKVCADDDSSKMSRYHFALRKVLVLTGGATLSDKSVVDNMSGSNNLVYDMSNLNKYEIIAPTEATNLKDTVEMTYPDNELLGLQQYNKEGYIVYKAADDKVFTGVEVASYSRDWGTYPTVSVSCDGVKYENVTLKRTSQERAGKIYYNDEGQKYANNDAAWNSYDIQTASVSKETEYKYVKVTVPAQSSSASQTKLSNVKLSLSTDVENTFVEQGYEETFENFDNTVFALGFVSNAGMFYVRDNYDGSEEMPCVMYQADVENGKSFGVAEITFSQRDFSTNKASVILTDKDGESVEWTGYSVTENTEKRGNNVFTDITFKGEIPANAKYITLSTSFLGSGWASRITAVKFSKPVQLCSKSGETTTVLDKLASGNVFGRAFCVNDTETEKNIQVIAVVKENGVVSSATVKSETLAANSNAWVDTEELTVGTVGNDTTLEVYVFDVTGGALTPMRTAKTVFGK